MQYVVRYGKFYHKGILYTKGSLVELSEEEGNKHKGQLELHGESTAPATQQREPQIIAHLRPDGKYDAISIKTGQPIADLPLTLAQAQQVADKFDETGKWEPLKYTRERYRVERVPGTPANQPSYQVRDSETGQVISGSDLLFKKEAAELCNDKNNQD